MSHDLVRKFVRSVLLAEAAPPPPDEPSVEPGEAMGRYVFPNDRINSSAYKGVGEEDTELEQEFWYALDRHYNGNDTGRLRAVWPKIIELERRGLYSSILSPPSGKVYRLMSLEPARAALFLGLTEAEIVTASGEAQVAPSPPPYRPRDFLSSWTLDPQAMIKISGTDFINAKPGQCSLLFVADTGTAEFLMNPREFGRGWKVGQDYAHEQEVIGGGEIPIETAAWMWHGLPEKLSPRMTVDKEIDTAYKSLYKKEAALRKSSGDSADPEEVRAKEFEIWSSFIYRIVGAIKLEIPDNFKFESMGNGIIRKLVSVAADRDEFDSFAEGKFGSDWMDIEAMGVTGYVADALDEHLEYSASKPKPQMPTSKVLKKLIDAIGGVGS